MGVEDTMDSGAGDLGGGEGVDYSPPSDSGGGYLDFGALGTAAGGFLSANASQYQAQVNSQISNYNAQVADQNAAQVIQMGEENARRSLIASSKVIASGRAAYGAAGVSGGSMQDVLRAGAAQGEMDALTIKYNAEVKANAFRNQANLDRYKAQNQTVAGEYNSAGDIIKTGAAVGTFIAALL